MKSRFVPVNDIRTAMERELKSSVLPVLRALSFRGSFPHFRRPRDGGIDLLTFQFDKWGGGFVAEIAQCGIDGFTTHWGTHIQADKVKAWDLHPRDRPRLQPRAGGGPESWFRFDDGNVKATAASFLQELPRAERWWQRQNFTSSAPGTTASGDGIGSDGGFVEFS